MIRVECAECGSVYRLSDEAAGKRIRCRKCKGVIPVPGTRRAERSATAAAAPRKRRSRPAGGFDEDFGNDDPGFGNPAALPPMTGGRKKKAEKKRAEPVEKPRRNVELIARLIAAGVALLVVLVFVILGFFRPAVAGRVGVTMLSVGIGEMVIGYIWLVVISAQEDWICGWLVRAVPFYAIYYMFTRFEETKWILLMWVTGVPLTIFALIYLRLNVPAWQN